MISLSKNKKRKLFVCHGRTYYTPDNTLTLDRHEYDKPDIKIDLTDKNFIRNFKIKLFKNYFDEVTMKYCPTSVYINVNPPRYRITKNTKPIFQTFKNIYYLLKPGGLLIINNFVLATKEFEQTSFKKLPKKYPESVNKQIINFVDSISDLFILEKINKNVILKKLN